MKNTSTDKGMPFSVHDVNKVIRKRICVLPHALDAAAAAAAARPAAEQQNNNICLHALLDYFVSLYSSVQYNP